MSGPVSTDRVDPRSPESTSNARSTENAAGKSMPRQVSGPAIGRSLGAVEEEAGHQADSTPQIIRSDCSAPSAVSRCIARPAEGRKQLPLAVAQGNPVTLRRLAEPCQERRFVKAVNGHDYSLPETGRQPRREPLAKTAKGRVIEVRRRAHPSDIELDCFPQGRHCLDLVACSRGPSERNECLPLLKSEIARGCL